MTKHHDDENPELQADLRARFDSAALQVLSYQPILVRLMRSCVPQAGKYTAEELRDYITSIRCADPDQIGPETAAKCMQLFGSAYLVSLPDGTDPLVFAINVDQAGQDYPQALMTRAEDEATQVIAAAMQAGEPLRKLYCLRVVVDPPEEYRHSILRSVATADSSVDPEPAALCSVCLYAMGDPEQLPPLTASDRRRLLS